MNITCPKCQASLQLPGNVEGEQVRCPVCREVFRAEQAKEAGGVQTGLPEVFPAKTTPKPIEDKYEDNYPITKRPPSYEDVAKPRWEEDEPLSEEEREILRDNAQMQTHFAGLLIVTTAGITAASLVIEFVLSYLQHLDQAQGNNDMLLFQTMWMFCLSVFFIPLILFAYLGGRSLLQLGPKSMIITGLVMNFVLTLAFLLGIGLNLLTIPFIGDTPILYVEFALDGVSCLLNLLAGIASTKALSQHAVQKFYRHQDQEFARRRRY